MEPIAGGSVLEALYREASTRRHTADKTQAEVLAADSARRDASKLSASSALLTSLRLSREVKYVFKQHSPAETGLLTRAQLQAALHSLGLLGNRPPTFSSSKRRAAAVYPNTPPARHLRQEGSIVDGLWQLLTGAQSTCMSATHRMKGTEALPLRSGRFPPLHLQPEHAAADEAESDDLLLSQGIDLWQQLIGDACLSHGPAHAARKAPKTPLPVSAAESALHTPMSGADSMCSTTNQPSQQKLQVKAGAKSHMHGVSLQQLLAFVQLVRQHSSGNPAAHPAVDLQVALSDLQVADLNKIARMCSQNKQANMAYVGIGKSRVQQKSLQPVHDRASGVSAYRTPKQQDRQADLAHKWQPQERVAKREVSQSSRFSRRNFRQRQRQLQHSLKQQVVAPKHQLRAAPRHKAYCLELGKQQPFARSESTAAHVVEHRKALAELELLPCTFSPALDPHSLALIAAKASAYQPPQKAALPHRQPTYTAHVGSCIASVSSTGIDSTQEADTVAESARSPTVTGPGHAYRPGWCATTSRDMQEERALRECTFAPRLNPNKTAKSIVAETWKSLPADCHHAAAAGATFQGSNASQEAVGHEGGSVQAAVASTSAAVLQTQHGMSNAPSGTTHTASQSAEPQTARARSNSSLRRANRRRQLQNSYAAAACKRRGGAAAVHNTAPVGAIQQQPHVGSTGSGQECEAQLQAEVAACDRQLEQCMAARQKERVTPKAKSDRPGIVASGAQQQQDGLSDHSSEGQQQQSALRVVIEAELADGSASRFEVQQADQLRHLTKYFATMMELQRAPLMGQSLATTVA